MLSFPTGIPRPSLSRSRIPCLNHVCFQWHGALFALGVLLILSLEKHLLSTCCVLDSDLGAVNDPKALGLRSPLVVGKDRKERNKCINRIISESS